MSQLKVAVTRASDTKIMTKATEAITLQKLLAATTKKLEEMKVFFREHANGEKMDITVAGQGSIQVKTPAFKPAASGKSIAINEAAFDALSPVTKRQLIRLGVVSYTAWKSKESISAAAVVITPNK